VGRQAEESGKSGNEERTLRLQNARFFARGVAARWFYQFAADLYRPPAAPLSAPRA